MPVQQLTIGPLIHSKNRMITTAYRFLQDHLQWLATIDVMSIANNVG